MLRSINVCMFHSEKIDISKSKNGRKGNALVIVALTKLDSTSEWFQLLEGFRRQDTECMLIETLGKADFVLEPGDAVIWRGDL